MPHKLATKDIKAWRESQLATTTSCPLCFREFTKVEPVADHDHTSGMMRGILCRNCNGLEGRCFNYAVRAAGKGGALMFLERLVAYLRFHTDNPSDMIHPNHGKPYKRKKRYTRRRKKTTKLSK